MIQNSKYAVFSPRVAEVLRIQLDLARQGTYGAFVGGRGWCEDASRHERGNRVAHDACIPRAWVCASALLWVYFRGEACSSVPMRPWGPTVVLAGGGGVLLSEVPLHQCPRRQRMSGPPRGLSLGQRASARERARESEKVRARLWDGVWEGCTEIRGGWKK